MSFNVRSKSVADGHKKTPDTKRLPQQLRATTDANVNNLLYHHHVWHQVTPAISALQNWTMSHLLSTPWVGNVRPRLALPRQAHTSDSTQNANFSVDNLSRCIKDINTQVTSDEKWFPGPDLVCLAWPMNFELLIIVVRTCLHYETLITHHLPSKPIMLLLLSPLIQTYGGGAHTSQRVSAQVPEWGLAIGNRMDVSSKAGIHLPERRRTDNLHTLSHICKTVRAQKLFEQEQNPEVGEQPGLSAWVYSRWMWTRYKSLSATCSSLDMLDIQGKYKLIMGWPPSDCDHSDIVNTKHFRQMQFTGFNNPNQIDCRW